MNYYYADADNQPRGPLTVAQLRGLDAARQLPAGCMVCAEGGQSWTPLTVLLAQHLPPPPVPASASAAMGGMIALVCGGLALVLSIVSVSVQFKKRSDALSMVKKNDAVLLDLVETSRHNRELEQKMQAQQIIINNGQVSQQVGRAIIQDAAQLVATGNSGLRELLAKHGITVNAAKNSSHEN